jgi:hypothetical protein
LRRRGACDKEITLLVSKNSVAALVVALSALSALSAHGATWAATAEPAKSGPAAPAKSETAKADENRKKPLRRCDELADNAQLECLRKAREKIVELRQKREAAAEKGAEKAPPK